LDSSKDMTDQHEVSEEELKALIEQLKIKFEHQKLDFEIRRIKDLSENDFRSKKDSCI